MSATTIIKSVLISSLLWLLFLPLLAPILILLWLFKSCVWLIAKLFRPDLKILNTADAGLVDNIRQRPLYNIGVLLVLEGVSASKEISIAQLQTHFKNNFLLKTTKDYDKFFKIYTSFSGYYFWEEAKCFKLENHVKEDSISCKAELDYFLSEWIKSSYPKDSPMWEMLLIKWPESNDIQGSALAFRIHHAYADGISILKLVEKLTGATVQGVDFTQVNIFRMMYLFFIFPHLLGQFMGKVQGSQKQFGPRSVRDDSFITFASLPLSQVKRIKSSLKIPFAAVLMSVVGGVFQKLLQEEGGPMPEFVYLGNALPWPTRQETMCNEWAIGVFKVPILTTDPIFRLKAVGNDIQDYLQSGIHVALKPILFGIISLIPFGFFHRFSSIKDSLPLAPFPIMSGSLMYPDKGNKVVLGCSITGAYPIVVNAVPHLALGCVSISHSNQMDFTIVSDKSIFPNVQNLNQKLKDYFLQEFKNIAAIAIVLKSADLQTL